jgi:hypothetical protein
MNYLLQVLRAMPKDAAELRVVLFLPVHIGHCGHAVAQLVEAPRYKPEGRGRLKHLIEISTRNITWVGVG